MAKQFATLDNLSVFNEYMPKMTPITQAAYDLLTPTEKNDPYKVYFITDATVTGVDIDDTTTALNKVWSSSKVSQSISNPNLVDNPFFTVNQRGQSSYNSDTANIYSFDRWIVSRYDTVSLSNKVMSVTVPTSGNVFALKQFMETDVYDSLIGKYVTLSVLKSDGTIVSKTALCDGEHDISLYFYQDGDKFGIFRLSYGDKSVTIRMTVDTTVSFKALKLEVGQSSTLHLDTEPNYATELLKCQRYFVNKVGLAISGFTYQQTATFLLPLPIKMRTIPVATINSKGNIVTTSGTLASWTTMSVLQNIDNGLYVRCALDNTSGDAFYPCNMGLVDITLSADL